MFLASSAFVFLLGCSGSAGWIVSLFSPSYPSFSQACPWFWAGLRMVNTVSFIFLLLYPGSFGRSPLCSSSLSYGPILVKAMRSRPSPVIRTRCPNDSHFFSFRSHVVFFSASSGISSSSVGVFDVSPFLPHQVRTKIRMFLCGTIVLSPPFFPFPLSCRNLFFCPISVSDIPGWPVPSGPPDRGISEFNVISVGFCKYLQNYGNSCPGSPISPSFYGFPPRPKSQADRKPSLPSATGTIFS